MACDCRSDSLLVSLLVGISIENTAMDVLAANLVKLTPPQLDDLAAAFTTGSRMLLTLMPLVVSWPGRVAPGSSTEAFVNFDDFAPTFHEVAGIDPLEGTTGRSLVPLWSGGSGSQNRDAFFLERKRHANVRRGDRAYPVRAIRARMHLYVRNLEPELWPVVDPEVWFSVGPFGDCDTTPTQRFILDHREEEAGRPFFDLNFANRPAEKLYDLRADPAQKCNVAADPAHAEAKRVLAARLAAWMRETRDPRAAVPTSPPGTKPTTSAGRPGGPGREWDKTGLGKRVYCSIVLGRNLRA